MTAAASFRFPNVVAAAVGLLALGSWERIKGEGKVGVGAQGGLLSLHFRTGVPSEERGVFSWNP